MSTNLINKGINTEYGYLSADNGLANRTNNLNENQDFYTTNYVLLKSGTTINVKSYPSNEFSSIFNEIAIHIYNMDKQWLRCMSRTASSHLAELNVEYRAESDCYIRFSMRGYRDFEHRAYDYPVDYTSRLEKFIYAICSMEVSDLPVPLSRIETLWNCLITGETPDFEPLSRNEKYLMAMLDRYDISNLPAPMSRGEKLLYKIAVGETDLSDVPGYLSRYEELLKYLIENGGIGDFEYVLYTLNQSLSTLYATVEKPVKSAILSGQTLVNLANYELSTSSKELLCSQDFSLQKNNTAYTLFNFTDKIITFNTYTTSSWRGFENVGANSKRLLTLNNFIIGEVIGKAENGWDKTTETEKFLNGYMIIEGDYTNVDIPYFEGMQSVKMPVLTTNGKNVFDFANSGLREESAYDKSMNGYGFWSFGVKLQPNKEVTISRKNNDGYNLGLNLKINNENTNSGGKWLIANHAQSENKSSTTLTTNSDGYIWFIFSNNFDKINQILDICEYIQIEYGTQATSYEPFKSNILTVNEDVELRGIGDVQDELNLLTGEISNNFNKITIDGTENWIYSSNETELTVRYRCNNIGVSILNQNICMCDRYNVDGNTVGDILSVDFSGTILTYRVLKSKFPTLKDFKKWLNDNPHTFIYQTEKSIKTVDLTTVDQDRQPTKLKTFNDITHVEINADNIIPSVDVEVATKISETLSTMGPQQLDISNTQNQLGQTIDEQTENTDATMMATTEIYENL